MKIFISHSSKDKQIVDAFIDLIVGVLGIDLSSIFSSSTSGTRIQSGENWRNSIRNALQESRIIFLFITKNYKNSEICQNEMGAVWMVDNALVLPIIIDPITFSSIGVLHEVNQIERLTDEGSLERIKDLFLNLQPHEIKSDRWNSKKKEFIKKVEDFSNLILEELIEVEIKNQNSKLQRGCFTEFIVDSSLSHSQSLSNISLNNKLISDLQRNVNVSIDLKFNYLGSLCANNWINLSGDPSYGHYKLVEIIKNNLDNVVAACNFNKDSKIDIISLGPGDGEIDKYLLHNFQSSCSIQNYYPVDISFDLLQTATLAILKTSWLQKKFKIKPIHGDFTELVNYIPVYAFDDNINFFSLLGFTFGDFNESELLGKIKEGMNSGDYLLLDVRLHEATLHGRITQDEKELLLTNYNHNANNRFAFGPLESVTLADYNSTIFEMSVNREHTVIAGAVNIVTSCKDINTKFRFDNKSLRKAKINLATTTLYLFDELEHWFGDRGVEVIWKKKINQIGLFLLKKE